MKNLNGKKQDQRDLEKKPLVKKITLKKDSQYEGGAKEIEEDKDKKKDYFWAWYAGITGIVVIIILVIVVLLAPVEDQSKDSQSAKEN